MDGAVYLVGQGPYREPRTIELQYLRILRLRNALAEACGDEYSLAKVYCDLNFPRDTYDLVHGFYDEPKSEFRQLLDEARNEKYDAIFIDIAEGRAFRESEFTALLATLKQLPCRIYNAYYDSRILADCWADRRGIQDQAGLARDLSLFNEDTGELVAFFPGLAASIVDEIVQRRMERSDLPEDLWRILSWLREENPYAANGFPEFSQHQRELLDRYVDEERARRRASETLYVLGPQHEGSLMDEGIIGPARSQESLVWAVHRLTSELGFSMRENANRIQFVRVLRGGVSFADPRIEGKIEFYVYPDGRRSSGITGSPAFSLPDRWKNDLEEKVHSQLRARVTSDS